MKLSQLFNDFFNSEKADGQILILRTKAQDLGKRLFFMFVYIALLAYNTTLMNNQARMVIMTASLVAGTIGFFWLKGMLKTIVTEQELLYPFYESSIFMYAFISI